MTPAVASAGSGSPGAPCAAPWPPAAASGASLIGSPAATAGTSGDWAWAAAEFGGHCATTASDTKASGAKASTAAVSRAARLGSLRQAERRTRRPLRCELAGSTKYDRQAISITNHGPQASFRNPTPDPLTNWKPASHRRRNVRIYGKDESDGRPFEAFAVRGAGLGSVLVATESLLGRSLGKLWGTSRYGDHGGLTVPSKAGRCPAAGGVLEEPRDPV